MTAQSWGAIWDYMPNTLRARELNQAYTDLENLYWRCFWWSLLRPFSKRALHKHRNIRMRIIEKKGRIRWLGGKVPPLWSL